MLARSASRALLQPARRISRLRQCTSPRIKTPSRRLATVAPTIPASTDDLELVALFDQPQGRSAFAGPSSTGIFQHSQLTTPASFTALADSTLVRAQLLTERIIRARDNRHELGKVVKNLDRLSDALCGVIDLAELVRNAHPDAEWVESANTSYEKLCEFMNVLNTHVGLYEVLRDVLYNPELSAALSPEARETALIFWRDFEKSAIALSPDKKERFVSLSSNILSVGRDFVNDSSSPRPPASIMASEIADLKDKGMGSRLRRQALFTQRELLVYPGSHQAHMIMRSAPSEEPRKKVYIASHTSTPEQVARLETLLRLRAELAQLVGRDSYSGMALSDKMAKSPENVKQFLDTSLERTGVSARRALHALSVRKQAHLNASTLPIIQAWDRDFYCPPEPRLPPVALPPLTLGRTIMALSRLFKHMYGISLRHVKVEPGEVWHSDVHKLEVVDEDHGVIGWIYADLFARPGKAPGAAHYTVRCSRRTDDDDESGDLTFDGADNFLRLSRDFEAAKRHRIRGREGEYQLPLVVLLCDFSPPTAARGATTIDWPDIMTFYHEMGHAMHSMIGRTEYHNVAGTRCATDFVELPSILMEHFLTSPRVLSLFETDGSSIANQTANHHEDPCHHIDDHTNVLLSILDQNYHSTAVLDPKFDSTSVLANLQNSRGLIPHVAGTSFQTQFGHLFGYGATYYSYLFDRTIASQVWRRVFVQDPLNRETGEKYKRDVLSFGGGKDPWLMLSTLLNAPELETGDAAAMREVGEWRLASDDVMPERH
ncbi:mitochondrial intermediate peptidase [Coniophora puteana RWD-64-598 SS2]|uniref:Mitochondrial intermediate peptidase n=1 Tax=Coniophora puteana (strain RWD-64-598) TaxID=741705 RepID=A0A5M3N6H0_CONPW|nr:mitochondrial intermediate peptidase [Coniophora puteana RWD-64-598 SS2]EIW87040.1 mitochondrial intermediate peptidase [Coniophora puteana RWD-64-598 SS2]